MPEHKNYELKITAQDGTGVASAWIGMGEKVNAPAKPKPDLYEAMDHGGHGGNHQGHEGHGGMLEAATNHAHERFRLSQTWNEIEARFETRKDYSWDGERDRTGCNSQKG